MEEENKKTPEAEQPHDENEKPIQPEEIDVPIDELTSQDITDASFDAETLLNAIQRHDVAKLNEFFETIPDADIAKACEQLDIKDVITLFRDTKSEQNASLYDELSQDLKESLVQAMTNKELVELINEQYADDVADTVGDMPANLAMKVLAAASPDMRKDINQLLKYKEDSAGAIMTTEFIELKEGMTIKKAIDHIRKRGRDAETIYTIFVKNEKRKFVGTVDLDDLIWAEDEQHLSDIMNKDAPFCHVNTDKEDVANMFSKYDLNAMAVLNDDNCLLGIVTVDDAVDVMAEENAEDIAHMTKMEPLEGTYSQTSPWVSAKKCIPWIVALLILGTFTTMVLNRLEAQTIFVSLPILVSFVPTLMDTGGNAGGQTTGLMIRGLATNEFGPKDLLKILWKEFRTALIVAAAISLFCFVWVTMEQYTGIVNLGHVTDTNGASYNFSDYNIWNGSVFQGELAGEFAIHALTFSGLVSVTMFFAITISKVIGTSLCMGAAAIKKDPALLAQPMLTTIMDVATLLVYFGMACLFFPAFA